VISGAHAILYTTDPDADRAFLRDVLGLPNVDVGGGWLIFGLPPSEIAMHPAETNGRQELYFLVEDIEAFSAAMGKRHLRTSPIQEERWGRLVELTLPSGATIGVYEPKHARPPATVASGARR
jgi:catechol 2,3-dioxygenase-like lactoylglutathione lyase family enzyme